jgi:exonuclease III
MNEDEWGYSLVRKINTYIPNKKSPRNTRFKCLMVLLPFFLSGPLYAEALLFASWNMNKLTHPSVGGSTRSQSDIRMLSRASEKIDADIVALQEVGSARIARDVFGSGYEYYMAEKDDRGLRVGFAVRAGVSVSKSYQYTLLAKEGGRMGVDLTVEGDDGRPVRILNVHLAEGCEESTLPNKSTPSCRVMSNQAKSLDQWVRYRKEEGIPFMLVGSFSRYLGAEQVDPYPGLLSLFNAQYEQFVDGLTTASGDKRPGCWNYSRPDFVDHFLLDPKMAKMVRAESFRESTISGSGKGGKKTAFSDHCPIKLWIRT